MELNVTFTERKSVRLNVDQETLPAYWEAKLNDMTIWSEDDFWNQLSEELGVKVESITTIDTDTEVEIQDEETGKYIR